MRNPGRDKKKWYYFWIFLILLGWGPAGHADNQWRILINIPQYKLFLYQGNELYRFYPIAVGKAGTPSPVGDFSIIVKIVNPTWYPPDGKQPPIPAGPGNPLGKYWLGLIIEGYGIHGNSAPWSIGNPISLGCIRMRNPDIEQLFQLVPVGTPVQITYQTAICGVDSNSLAWVELFPDIYSRETPELELFNILNQLDGFCYPHYEALQCLMTGSKRPCKIQVPREISIQGDVDEIDGFYWDKNLYVSKQVLTALPATATPIEESPLFPGYLEVSKMSNLNGIQINWDEAANILIISRDRNDY